MEQVTTDTMINLACTCKQYLGFINTPGLWTDVETDLEYPDAAFMDMLLKYASNIIRFKCKFKHELLFNVKLNEVIPFMGNLRSLNLQSCRVFYSAFCLQHTPKLVYLNVSECPWLSTTSLIAGIKFLPNLKFFHCNNKETRMSAYSVWECTSAVTKLEQLSCKNSGIMVPWIAVKILRKCPALLKFHFTTDSRYDTDTTKLQWYHIVKRKFAHVEFTDEVIAAVDDSIINCSLVQV